MTLLMAPSPGGRVVSRDRHVLLRLHPVQLCRHGGTTPSTLMGYYPLHPEPVSRIAEPWTRNTKHKTLISNPCSPIFQPLPLIPKPRTWQVCVVFWKAPLLVKQVRFSSTFRGVSTWFCAQTLNHARALVDRAERGDASRPGGGGASL